MLAWADVVAIGRALPEVEEGTWYRTPCLRVRKKSFWPAPIPASCESCSRTRGG